MTNEQFDEFAVKTASDAISHILSSKRLTDAHKAAALALGSDLLDVLQVGMRRVVGIGISQRDAALIREAAAASALSTMTQAREMTDLDMLKTASGKEDDEGDFLGTTERPDRFE